MAKERRETCNLCDVKNKWFDRESTNLVQSSTLAKILFFCRWWRDDNLSIHSATTCDEENKKRNTTIKTLWAVMLAVDSSSTIPYSIRTSSHSLTFSHEHTRTQNSRTQLAILKSAAVTDEYFSIIAIHTHSRTRTLRHEQTQVHKDRRTEWRTIQKSSSSAEDWDSLRSWKGAG